METKMKLGPLQKEWVKQLREHPERQTDSVLGYKNGDEIRLCCLGQAGLITGVAEFNGDSLHCNGSTSYLACGAHEAMGLRSEKGHLLRRHVSASGRELSCLSEINDYSLTWPEIADYIEQNPENVFTKSV